MSARYILFISPKHGSEGTQTIMIAINMFYMSHKNDTPTIEGLTPECMDEIAYNAINTDASSQIDILTSDATFKTKPKDKSNKSDVCIAVLVANIEKISHTKVDLNSTEEDMVLNDNNVKEKLKEDRNEFCSVVGNDNKMGADVKGNPFVRF